ncbi:hypothetical protein EVAR_9598_1 [Eumeta japonica]|uniref:Secreted protein n=1 Tax=Eumeta variegata TaxID=151549 RepID=A0A4C1TM67_EUMVA|nr:hypothetical protein EVAR_9598_1 [Eumeta japonica]
MDGNNAFLRVSFAMATCVNLSLANGVSPSHRDLATWRKSGAPDENEVPTVTSTRVQGALKQPTRSLHPGGCDCRQFPEDVPGWHETTRPTDIARRIKKLKGKWLRIFCKICKPLRKEDLERRSRTKCRSVGRAPTRWSNDLVKVTGHL